MSPNPKMLEIAEEFLVQEYGSLTEAENAANATNSPGDPLITWDGWEQIRFAIFKMLNMPAGEFIARMARAYLNSLSRPEAERLVVSQLTNQQVILEALDQGLPEYSQPF